MSDTNNAVIFALVAKRFSELRKDFARLRAQTEQLTDGEQGPKGETGEQGPPGPKGDAGPKGDKGDLGPMPKHQWKGTQVRFEKPDGKWGPWVELEGAPGAIVVGGGGGAAVPGPQGPAGAMGATGAAGPAGPAGPVGVPYFIPDGDTFVVPENQQCLSAMDITIDGILQVDGFLVEVL